MLDGTLDRDRQDRRGPATCAADQRSRSRRGGDLSAVIENDAGHATVSDEHAPHARAQCGSRRRLHAQRPPCAAVTAPGPPFAVMLLPPGAGSAAALRSRRAAVPADHGPVRRRRCRARRSAPAADPSRTIPPTRSAADIGPHRSSANRSFLPSPRKRIRPFSSSHISPRCGASMAGGVMPRARGQKVESRASVSQNSMYFAASLAENAADRFGRAMVIGGKHQGRPSAPAQPAAG